MIQTLRPTVTPRLWIEDDTVDRFNDRAKDSSSFASPTKSGNVESKRNEPKLKHPPAVTVGFNLRALRGPSSGPPGSKLGE